MNHKEARKILNVADDADEKAIKKAFKTESKRWHPDVCKEAGAEDKFKEINDAYQTLQKPEESSDFITWGDVGFNPFHMNNVQQRKVRRITFRPEPDVILKEKITFSDAFNGTTIKIHYGRLEPCNDCRGQGIRSTSDKCDACGGNGIIEQAFTQGNATYKTQMHCGACGGSGKKLEDCMVCKDGKIHVTRDLNVKIPFGIKNGTRMVLSHQGHWDPTSMSNWKHVYLDIEVEEHPSLWIEGKNLWTKQTVSLLDALEGCRGPVTSMRGEETIIVPAKTHHHDVITLSGGGPGGKGDFCVRIDIDYGIDKETDKLIEFLHKEKNGVSSELHGEGLLQTDGAGVGQEDKESVLR